MALEMADADTPTEDMNVVRYLLCYLYFYLGDYYDAAAMGEFVAMRYPQSSGARQCAKITMASYIKARKDALVAAKAGGWTDDVKFESDKITEICRFITKEWSDQQEAFDAANTLIIFSLQDHDFEKAAEYLAVIPDNLPQRGASERLIGQQIWTVFLTEVNRLEREGVAKEIVQAKKKEMEADISNAAGLLEKGLGRIGSEQVTQPIAGAALSLAQIYVERNETDRALALLNDPKIGPLSLVKQKHAATTVKPGYDIEAYKTALRANIAALSDKDKAKQDAANANAEEIIGLLTTAVGSTAEGEERLVGTFINMAKKLKGQMDAIEDFNEKKAFAAGLSGFLDQVNKTSDKMGIRTWVADTYSKIGEAFAADPQAARPYYEDSVKAFSGILKAPDLAEGTRLQIEMRLGDTKLLLEDYEGALDEYVKVLRKKNSMLNVQVAAAMAFQRWGDSLTKTPKEAEKKYIKAMVGDFEDDRETIGGVRNKSYKRNVVWGWGKLFQITMRYPQFRNTFYESRYNLAWCRFGLAQLKDSDKYRHMAKNDILSTMKVAADMGGPNWRPKFNGLMVAIQKSLNEKQSGLPDPPKK
jgi:tetratricopeptide (TPR) repeat protein